MKRSMMIACVTLMSVACGTTTSGVRTAAGTVEHSKAGLHEYTTVDTTQGFKDCMETVKDQYAPATAYTFCRQMTDNVSGGASGVRPMVVVGASQDLVVYPDGRTVPGVTAGSFPGAAQYGGPTTDVVDSEARERARLAGATALEALECAKSKNCKK